MKLPPRAAFTAQIIGTLFGSVLNFGSSRSSIQWKLFWYMWQSAVLMNSIIDNQRPNLLSVEGTNVWSGQQPQQYNSQAIAWGGLRCDLFSLASNLSMTVPIAINCLPLANNTNLSPGHIWLDWQCPYHSGSCTSFGPNWGPITCTPLSFGTSAWNLYWPWSITITDMMNSRQLFYWLARRGH